MACLATETGGSTVDVERIRRDMVWDAVPTPVAHFNSAGDSPMPLKVLERVQTHMQMEATLGGYEAAANVQEELEAVYSSAAQLINAKPEEIALQVNYVYVPRMYVSMSPSPGGSLLHTSHLTYIEENTCSASFLFLVTCTHQFSITHTRCRVTIRVVEYQTLVDLNNIMLPHGRVCLMCGRRVQAWRGLEPSTLSRRVCPQVIASSPGWWSTGRTTSRCCR